MARHGEILDSFKQKVDNFDFTNEEHVTCVSKNYCISTFVAPQSSTLWDLTCKTIDWRGWKHFYSSWRWFWSSAATSPMKWGPPRWPSPGWTACWRSTSCRWLSHHSTARWVGGPFYRDSAVSQSDREKSEGLPVAPFMDRDKVTKPTAQIGFIKFVLIPMFETVMKVGRRVH